MTVFTPDERAELIELFDSDETYTATGDPASTLMTILVDCCDCDCDGVCDCECHE